MSATPRLMQNGGDQSAPLLLHPPSHRHTPMAARRHLSTLWPRRPATGYSIVIQFSLNRCCCCRCVPVVRYARHRAQPSRPPLVAVRAHRSDRQLLSVVVWCQLFHFGSLPPATNSTQAKNYPSLANGSCLSSRPLHLRQWIIYAPGVRRIWRTLRSSW